MITVRGSFVSVLLFSALWDSILVCSFQLNVRSNSFHHVSVKNTHQESVAPLLYLGLGRHCQQKSCLASKKGATEEALNSHTATSFAVGTFVEFEEKNHRVHCGKISQQEHKSNGAARYVVLDGEGKRYNIADKAVRFVIHPPNSPGPANKLFKEFCAAQEASDEEVESQLQISPELLEITWEEALDRTGEDSGILTPSTLIEMVHSHTASAIEGYMAWRYLQSDVAHVFFKEMKDKGRVISFKTKARNAVDAAKQTFCTTHASSDLCLI